MRDIGGEILLVSQFTLYFRNKAGNLDFSRAMPPDAARTFYQEHPIAPCSQNPIDEPAKWPPPSAQRGKTCLGWGRLKDGVETGVAGGGEPS